MLKIEKELEKRLNDYWRDSTDEFYSFKVTKADDTINILCLDDLGNMCWEIQVLYDTNMDMAALITRCINTIYDVWINPLNKIVKDWKGYINRKVKSLGLAMSKNDTDKIQKLNKYMTEQYKRMMDAKFMVSEYKIFVTMFYIIKEEYEPVKEIV